MYSFYVLYNIMNRLFIITLIFMVCLFVFINVYDKPLSSGGSSFEKIRKKRR